MERKRNRRVTQKAKVDRGDTRVINKKPTFDREWELNWFQPTAAQQLIVEAMDEKELILVRAPSGCGKSATVLWKALVDYKSGKYKQVYLVKNPVEAGDDQLGLLSGDKNQKLTSHIEAMKSIFHQFMSKGKLENDLSNGNIVIDIPNYLLGRTIDDSLIILEEAQTMSPATIKLVCERAGQGSTVVVVGDPKQCYSIKRREDGLKDLIQRVTYDDGSGTLLPKFQNVAYIEMQSDNNMRSSLSRFITELYD